MLVIADSSPLHALVEIGNVQILAKLFSRVLIPPQVAKELSHARTPEIVKRFIAHPPDWLQIQSPTVLADIPGLDIGELAAISLACELQPDFVLLDERAGRLAATERQLIVIGTVGILERAADENLIDLKQAFESLRQTRFRVSEELLDNALLRHQRKPS